jgi:TonB-linked SusC/RagA family outer membrane protein
MRRLCISRRWFSTLILLSVSGILFAQQAITGTVKDERGEFVIGASITVKENKTVGTITDLDGNFSLQAYRNNTLVVSYIGYITQEIPVAGKTNFSVVLKEDNLSLDEVIVIGYGTQRKGDVTSSVASVKPENFVKGAVKDVGQLIQGKVAGLAITNPSGNPVDGTQIKLRGTNTIGGANTSPLVLIDGIPGELSTIAPEDVESVDVLKDGSAAAIYGTRGTNGVILITTKQTQGGQNINSVEYNGYISTAHISNKLEMLDADGFRTLYPDYDAGANTDWLKEITRTPVSHVHNLSLQGGNSNTNYIANVNYSSQQGIMLKSGFENFRGRIEITHRMFDDKLRVKFGIFGRKNQYSSTSSGGSFRGVAYSQATRRNPTDPVKNEDGSWYENLSKFEYENPVALLEECEGNVKNTTLRFNGNMVYNPIKDLTLSAVTSYARNNRNRGYSETLNHISAQRDGFTGWSSVGGYTSMEKILELTAQYNKEIKGHKFSILGGYSYTETDYEDMDFSNYGFQDDYFGGWHNIGIGSALKEGKAGAGSSRVTTNLIGFFGRATYSCMDRYLLMASLRYEGASQLWGTDNEWGVFPSISVGWRITQEPFMKGQTIFDDLKLRAGYGITGSQIKDPFLGIAMLKYEKYAYVNGQWVQTIVPASNANPDLKWEEKKETNIGLDFVSSGGRLSGSVDFYSRDVDGLLYEYAVSVPPNLYGKTWANGGKMQNRGVEILLSGIPVQNTNVEWQTSVTYSYNNNKLKSLSGSTFKTEHDYFNTGTLEYSGQTADSHRVQVGLSIGNFYGFKVVDVDDDGYWIYEDRNGDLVNYKDFTHAPDDKHVIGNGLPKWYAGWNNNLRYKGFDLSITMRGAFGFQIINAARMNYEGTKNSRVENRLKSVNDKVFGKRLLSKEVEPEFNSYYVEDGDYWKIDNITLGYTFGKMKSKYIKSLHIYASVLNAFTITGYKGIDPEVSTDGLTPGYDSRDRYPSVRTFTLGLGVKF